MKNIFRDSLISIGGKKVWCFQSYTSFVDGWSKKHAAVKKEFLKFLEISENLEKSLFLAIFKISDKEGKEIDVFNSFNYCMLKGDEYGDKVVYIFHNKKVKAIKVFTGQMEFILVNKEDICRLYDIESSFWFCLMVVFTTIF